MFRVVTFAGDDVTCLSSTQESVKQWAKANDLHVMFGYDDGHLALAHVKPLKK